MANTQRDSLLDPLSDPLCVIAGARKRTKVEKKPKITKTPASVTSGDQLTDQLVRHLSRGIDWAIFFHCARDRKATGSASLLDMPLPRASRELYDVACLAGHRAAIRPIAPLCLNLTLHREERAPTTCHSFWTLERRGERCLAYLATVPEIPHPLGLVGPSLDL